MAIDITALIGYVSMAFIILAWYLTRKHYVKSQIAGIVANMLYAAYGFMLAMEGDLMSHLPIILLGFILTGINTYNLWSVKRSKK
jgi:hypothetical protein